MQLFSDLIYFFLVLNTIIHSHNGISSAFIVIIRLLYTLTALDTERNCWISGYGFHYQTPFSFPTYPCGIWHALSSSCCKMLLPLEPGQLERNEHNASPVLLQSRFQLSPRLGCTGPPNTTYCTASPFIALALGVRETWPFLSQEDHVSLLLLSNRDQVLSAHSFPSPKKQIPLPSSNRELK